MLSGTDAGFPVIPDCTWMESTWTRWRCIRQSSCRCRPARQCCHRLFAGITLAAGMSQLSLSSLLSARTGLPAAQPALLKLMSHHRIRKMHISLDTWLMVVSCFRQLVTSCWPGASLLECWARHTNRHLFLLTMFTYTEPLYFHHLVSL